ncbi:HK97 gp10 family phage protein [Brevibacillus brevis]|uniref:HK97 gp10 family phage protein n=1 Tax=Brevibacillus brevis TaxID=1393 RepID=UPI00115AE7CF|nr:HK97 gp10 family phage protein [Lysinibacillus sp. SDF0063]TQR33972.1 HK97 gp10 family phage protein [Lysinibacillus sp. SDF0063]
MSSFDVDWTGLDDFLSNIRDMERHFPNEAKRMLRNAGGVARKMVLKRAKQSVVEDTGEYFASIKRGKAWVDRTTGEYKIRAYSKSRHAHLIEHGHRMVGPEPNKQEVGFVLGFHVFDKARQEINRVYPSILQQEYQKILQRL